MAAAGQLRRRTRARTPPRAVDAGDDDVRCEACGSGEAGAELMLCDGCDRGYHIFCLRPILPLVPAGDWFCAACRSPPSSSKSSPPPKIKKPKQFPLVQTKIVDFFKIQRNPAAPELSEAKKRKRKPAGALVLSKKKRKLLPFNPREDPAQRLRQMASLATATSSHTCQAWRRAPSRRNAGATEGRRGDAEPVQEDDGERGSSSTTPSRGSRWRRTGSSRTSPSSPSTSATSTSCGTGSTTTATA